MSVNILVLICLAVKFSTGQNVSLFDKVEKNKLGSDNIIFSVLNIYYQLNMLTLNILNFINIVRYVLILT